jgi:hypothetical protein
MPFSLTILETLRMDLHLIQVVSAAERRKCERESGEGLLITTGPTYSSEVQLESSDVTQVLK